MNTIKQNMNQFSQPNSPSYQGQNSYKNSRIYQQILTGSYLQDTLYSPNQDQPASIKFNTSHYQQTNSNSEPEEICSRSAQYHNPFKTFESAKNSHTITQSLGSNYSIIQMENQSYSTLNLYSISRNIQHDHSLSSNNITQKLNHDHSPAPQQSKHSDLMLEGSINRQAPTIQEVSCLELQDKMKKYKSQEFVGIQDQQPSNQEEGDNSPLPRLLAQKYLQNDINRKFSTSHPSDHGENNFKTVLNEVYVVPYKINQQVQPYAFSIPAELPKDNKIIERKGKANSLNLNHSRRTQNNQEENRYQNQMYFSSHTHFPQEKVQLQVYNTTMNSDYRQRPVQRSEPKPCHFSNQKTARSNSIDCKNKPVLVSAKVDTSSPQIPSESLDHSRVMRVFKQEEKKGTQEMSSPAVDNSIIYDQKQINICCGLTSTKKQSIIKEQSQSNASKINFLNKNDQKNSFFTEPVPSSESLTSKRITGYKINPLAMIKSKHENRQGESQKKGIKLIGYNSSLPSKGSH